MNTRILHIAIGKSRKEKNWKNKKVSWEDLANKLSQPKRTDETLKEYQAMSKKDKAELKDVGGFVAGYCNNGKRTDVRFRTCITLDADSVKSDIWEDWLDCYGNAACMYSTHSHTAEEPRYRLVIPADRDMDPDEYQAVSRRIAETLGMDNFDESTHQAQRLMYWPSCSKDANYVFERCEGELLKVDDVLATYVDWRDASAWPTGSDLPVLIEKLKKHQQDPLEKPGLIGAFCRAYAPIQAAIEEFIPTYEPCDENRYTYTEGSAAAGVVIYGDNFSYSNHATDPASCVLCNAFDLVRLHKFGELDADCPENIKPIERPSYKAMVEFASGLDKVKIQMYNDRAADFDELPAGDDDNSWKALLEYNGKGGMVQSTANAFVILSHDPDYKGKLVYDEMGRREAVIGKLPWDTGWKGKMRKWDNEDDAALRLYLERRGLQGKDRIFDALTNVTREHHIHPVKEFIEEVSWDGTKRVERLLIDYLGAEDTEYVRTVTRKTLVGAVARIYNPGCKFDYVLCLKGPQGLGKSSLLKTLTGEWFSDSLVSMTGKEAFEQLCGVWIMEVSELASMKRSEIENVKGFLSARSDSYRPAYARRTEDFPRQCIFVATTNEAFFLRDKTGNRRFWVVECKKGSPHTWNELDDETVHQIWAEAKVYFDKGESLFLSQKLEEEAGKIQEQYTEEDPRVGVIADYLSRQLPENWQEKDLESRREWLGGTDKGVLRRTTVCAKEIFCEALGGNPDRATTQELKPINEIMANEFPEWVRDRSKRKRVPGYNLQRIYLLDGHSAEWERVDNEEDEEDSLL